MTNKRIRDIEGYEAFKADCEFFRCEEEYPGWTGTEKYGIITALTKEELEAKYPQFIAAMSPYILLGSGFGEIRAESKKNDDKFEKRAMLNDHLFEMDEEAEAMHPELSVPDFLTEMIEKNDEKRKTKLAQAICCGILAQMSEVQKRRIVMRHVLNKTFDEIAEIEGCTQEAVIKSVKNAEKKFRILHEKGLVFDTPNSIHSEGVSSILDRIAASAKKNVNKEDNQNGNDQ